MPAKTVKWGIQVDGAANLQKALRVLAEPDAPYLRDALEDVGRSLAREAASRAPGGIGRAVQFVGVKGKANALRSMVQIKHPGSRSMEFGRQYYYRGYTGRRVKSGQRFRSNPGQPARPYIGIVRGDAAMGAIEADAQRKIADAIEAEWERIGTEAE